MKRWDELENHYIHGNQRDKIFWKWLTKFRGRRGSNRKWSVYQFSWLGQSDDSKAKTKSPDLMEKNKWFIISGLQRVFHILTRPLNISRCIILSKKISCDLPFFKESVELLYYYLLEAFKNTSLCADTSDRHIVEYPSTFQLSLFLLFLCAFSQVNFN